MLRETLPRKLENEEGRWCHPRVYVAKREHLATYAELIDYLKVAYSNLEFDETAYKAPHCWDVVVYNHWVLRALVRSCL